MNAVFLSLYISDIMILTISYRILLDISTLHIKQKYMMPMLSLSIKIKTSKFIVQIHMNE